MVVISSPKAKPGKKNHGHTNQKCIHRKDNNKVDDVFFSITVIYKKDITQTGNGSELLHCNNYIVTISFPYGNVSVKVNITTLDMQDILKKNN